MYTLGIEIEFFNVHHTKVYNALKMVGIEVEDMVHKPISSSKKVTKHWKLVADSSVTGDNTGAERTALPSEVESGEREPGATVPRGLELVSPIMSSQNLRQLRAVLRVLKTIGATVDESCGVHFHVGVPHLSLPGLKQLMINMACHEEFFDSISPIHRRENNNKYCRSVRFNHTTGQMDSLHEFKDELTNLSGDFISRYCVVTGTDKSCDPKYKKLNVKGYPVNRTVEFRHMYGCLDYDVVKTWLDMFVNIIEESNKGV